MSTTYKMTTAEVDFACTPDRTQEVGGSNPPSSVEEKACKRVPLLPAVSF